MGSLRRTARLGLAVSLAGGALLAVAGCNTRFGATLDRPADPVVLQGSSLPKLVGTDPQAVVGFAWDGSSWHQVPVQVDERDLISPGVIYHLAAASYPKLFGTTTPYKILVYTPPATLTAGYTSTPTYTPSDSDPTVDANDEVSFLAADTGKQAPAATPAPSGVDASSREEVQATDPLHPTSGYVYLFHGTSLTGGSAGTTGVVYTFSLDSGDYTTTYKMGTSSLSPNNVNGFNPEHSTVSTPWYTQSFADRWLGSGLSIVGGGASGADLLDRSKYYVTNAACARTEDTFDGGATNPYEGAFVVNLSGPVRAIRSYIGANSYKYTVNTDVFYPDRQDTVTELRGHSGLPGFGASDDLTTGLSGLTYSDPANAGLTVDGTPDAFTTIHYTTGGATPPVAWQMVSGAAGSLVTVHTLTTDISGLNVNSVYADQSPASTVPCTGDTSVWGQNGFETTSPVFNVPVTDPTLTATPALFVSQRVRFFERPGLGAADAAALDARAKAPITTSVTG